eukprot:GGOE01056195.1.p1 GENE.GGOE01056195.1~~GGOE01056195.1.p1  ORF type:complete len:184 (-),score=26.34 GGOE01056195.1:4-555(-)
MGTHQTHKLINGQPGAHQGCGRFETDLGKPSKQKAWTQKAHDGVEWGEPGCTRTVHALWAALWSALVRGAAHTTNNTRAKHEHSGTLYACPATSTGLTMLPMHTAKKKGAAAPSFPCLLRDSFHIPCLLGEGRKMGILKDHWVARQRGGSGGSSWGECMVARNDLLLLLLFILHVMLQLILCA